MKNKITFLTLSIFFAFSAMGQTTEKTPSTKNSINKKNMKSLKIERHFNVAPERVFAIFTNPEEMIVWWTKDTEFVVDLKVGGHYTITREENGVTHRMKGEYLEVEHPNKLKYTCAMPDFSPITDTISIEIKPDGKGGSLMTFIQEGEGINAELQELPSGNISTSEKGWQIGFDLMEKYWNNHNTPADTDSLQQQVNQQTGTTKTPIITSLTFQKNDAEEAMNFYISLFKNSRVINISRWGKDGPGKEGTIMQAVFELNGHRFMVSDSPPVHNWDFTPAISMYVECENDTELETLFSKLSENGDVAMPLDNYGFSQKFGWVIDRFGVSWQLNLE